MTGTLNESESAANYSLEGEFRRIPSEVYRDEDEALGAFELVRRLIRLSRLLERALNKAAGSQALSLASVETLMFLKSEGRPYSGAPCDLASAVALSRSAMTLRLDKLQRAGLVSRTVDIEDRAMVVVQLTNEGSEIANAEQIRYSRVAEGLLEPFSDRQRRALQELLSQFTIWFRP